MLWEHEVVGSNPIVPTKRVRFIFMFFKNVVIDVSAYALPEDIWTSDRIEQALSPAYTRLGLPLGRLELMTGIRERRHWPSSMLSSEAATKAGAALLRKAQINTNEIDVLIHASVCRDCLEPATAAYIHKGLGLSQKTQIFDLSNACLGVLNAFVVGASMIEAGAVRSVLIVSGENGKPLLDNTLRQLNENLHLTRKEMKSSFANLTIGSGAVAILLRHAKDVTSPRPLLLGGIAQTDSSANALCEGNTSGQGLSMQTNSSALLEAGVSLSQKAWSQFKDEMRWDETTADHIITHQVGSQHQKQLYNALHLDLHKDFSTFSTLGNTGSVALPISLCLAEENHRLRTGDRVLLLGIGSGLSTIMLGVLWQ